MTTRTGKYCPICGSELTVRELDLPYCGATCAACDALSEDELAERYPVWAQELPSLSECYRACKDVREGHQARVELGRSGWAVWQGPYGGLEVFSLDNNAHAHPLEDSPRRAAVIMWQLIRRLHGIDTCFVCHRDMARCSSMQDCGRDTGLWVCRDCVAKKIKSGHY